MGQTQEPRTAKHDRRELVFGIIGLVLLAIYAVGTMLQGLGAQDVRFPELIRGAIGQVGHVARLMASWPFAFGAFTGLVVVGRFASKTWLGALKSAPQSPVEEVTRRAAKRLVGELHRRWFSDGRDLDKGYRVSLFMPMEEDGKKLWRCVARTIDAPELAATWAQVDDAQERPLGGLVNHVAIEQEGVGVEGVPDAKRKNSVEVARYLNQCCVSKEVHEARSWKWATLLLRLARSRKGNILCVIVVERESGEPIRHAKSLSVVEKVNMKPPIEREICAWELQLAAELWAALRENEH